MATASLLSFDPILDAIDRAPAGEPFTREQKAYLRQAMADIASGRTQLVAHEDVPAWLEARSRHEHGG